MKQFIVRQLGLLLLFLFVFDANASQTANYALVYDGEGACDDGCPEAAAKMARRVGLRVRFINAQNWSKDKFNDASIWIQPGGDSVDVAMSLNHEQKEEIRSFIRGGGGYVGFCAGAFLASEKIRDGDKYWPVETLGLIPMETDYYNTDDEVATVPIYWQNSKRFLYWQGGPAFVPPVPSLVEVVAYYTNGQTASVRTNYGEGRVFVIGLHPEASWDWRMDYNLKDIDGLDYDISDYMINWATKSIL